MTAAYVILAVAVTVAVCEYYNRRIIRLYQQMLNAKHRRRDIISASDYDTLQRTGKVRKMYKAGDYQQGGAA